MGFQRGVLRLEFTGEFAGLEVRSHRFSVGELLDVMTFPARVNTGSPEERKEALSSMAALLDARLVSWNYEDEGGLPVEKNTKTISALDRPMLEAILRGIVSGSNREADAGPLGTPSGDGDSESPIPMEPLDESPPS